MHCIEQNTDGTWRHAYVGEVGWHGLGQPAPETVGWEEFMRLAGADWTVSKRSVSYKFDGKTKTLRDTKVLVRDTDGAELSVVSKGWEPVQNEEAFRFFDQLVEAGHMRFDTAGVLMDGRKVWVLAKIDRDFELRVDGRKTEDTIKGYCLFTNHHEYGKCTDGRFVATRVVCNNTHQMAMSERNSGVVRLDHRKKFDAERMKELLGLANTGFDAYEEAAEFLASKRYELDKAKAFFQDLFPRGRGEDQEKLSKVAQIAVDILETQPGAEFAPGTYWNVFNSATFVMDHVMGKTQESRLNSSWYGINRGKKQAALNSALELARAA